MAWTASLAHVVSGADASAAAQNQLIDNVNIIGAAWTSYTPTLKQGASTNIAKTVNRAKYLQVGKTVWCQGRVTATAAGTAAAAIEVTLPFTAGGGLQGGDVVGSGDVYDTSATTHYPTPVVIQGFSTTICWQVAGGLIGASGMTAAIASGDYMTWSVIYEVD